MTTTARGARPAAWVFGLAVAAAFPIILSVGSFHWFLRDEWSFLAERELSSVNDLFRPHALTHWSTLPIIAYRALWNVFGVRTYLPYQALVVALHLTIAVLLRTVMRRAGVSPWMATVGAAPFLFFGPGSQNILWAFQIGFTGSMVLGLTHLLLATHEGDVDRRDWLGLLAGFLALMCSGVGVSMAVATGAAVLVLRGWRLAALHTAPLAAAYLIWAAIEHPQTTSTGFGYPSPRTIAEWLGSTVTGTFSSLGAYTVLSFVLAAVFVVGLALAWRPDDDGTWRRLRLALPAGLLVGLLGFSLSTVMGRWPYGTDFGRASRYLYIAAALALPALVVAADALARRWTVLTPVLMVLLLLPIPFNLDGFSDDVFFGRRYFDSEERLLRTAVRMPFAREVPRDVLLIPDPYHEPVTIGFLLDAERNGKLEPSRGPVSRLEENELRVRLGVAQRHVGPTAEDCQEHDEPLDVRGAHGQTFRFDGRITVSTLGRRGQASSAPVVFAPVNGHHLTIELPDLDVRVAPARGAESFEWCRTA